MFFNVLRALDDGFCYLGVLFIGVPHLLEACDRVLRFVQGVYAWLG